MKHVVYNVVWWTLFATLICFAVFNVDDLAFYWLSGFLIGAAIYRIFDKYFKLSKMEYTCATCKAKANANKLVVESWMEIKGKYYCSTCGLDKLKEIVKENG